MPASSLPQRQGNLARLRGALSPHCEPDADRKALASRWAARLPLTHSTSPALLIKIIADNALLSQQQAGARRGYAEELLETGDDVFLYAGAFAMPGFECGFLFTASLEGPHATDGVATPFDSGALARHVLPPAPYGADEAGRISFIRDHELPVSDYRELLADVIAAYSLTPEAHISDPCLTQCPCAAPQPHPMGLTGVDRRGHTFEVRIPQRVPLTPPSLRAVFLPEGFEPPELHVLFAAGIHIERYAPDDGGNFFHTMRESCVNFICQHFAP